MMHNSGKLMTIPTSIAQTSKALFPKRKYRVDLEANWVLSCFFIWGI